MKTVDVGEARTHLSELLRQIQTGVETEIVIAIDGEPVARLVPYERPPRRVLGIDEGLFTLTSDFFDADEEIAKLFNGD